MKKIAPLLLALLGVVLVVPFVVGGKVKTGFESGLLDFNTAAASTLQARLVDYRRGWFGSQARLELSLTDAYVAKIRSSLQDPGEAMDVLQRPLVLLMTVQHGPLVRNDGMQFGWAGVVARPDPEVAGNGFFADALDTGNDWLTVAATVGLDGGVDYTIEVVSIDTVGGEGIAFKSSPLVLSGNAQGSRITTTLTMDLIEFHQGLVKMQVEGIHFDVDYTLLGNSIGTGTSDGTIATFSMFGDIAGEPTNLLQVNQTHVASVVALDSAGEFMTVSVDYGIESIQPANGPKITAVAVGMALAKLDLAALQTLGERMQAVQGEASPDGILAKLGPALARLLRSNPTAVVDPIRFLVEGEPFEASVQARSNWPERAIGEADFANPVFWQEVFAIDAQLSAAKPLATNLAASYLGKMVGGQVGTDQVAGMLGGMVMQGMLVDAGESYTVQVSYEGGVTTVNGNVMPTR